MGVMTQQKRKFCQYIVSGLNQTRAAVMAGYKESSAKVQGSQLMAMKEIQDYIADLRDLDSKGSIPIEEDVAIAELCKDPIQKLIELMNCEDVIIEKEAAKALLPYFYLKKSESEAPKKIGIRELKEANAIKQTSESKFSTLGNQLSNTYEHEKE